MAVKSKTDARSRRHTRLRKKVVGTPERPRLVVTRSARHVFVQLVDDSKGLTLASASTLETDLRALDGDKTAKAHKVGELVAERSLFNAQLSQAQTKGGLFLSMVNIYRSMGGGWVTLAEQQTMMSGKEGATASSPGSWKKVETSVEK